jgi:hypothetical protein
MIEQSRVRELKYTRNPMPDTSRDCVYLQMWKCSFVACTVPSLNHLKGGLFRENLC